MKGLEMSNKIKAKAMVEGYGASSSGMVLKLKILKLEPKGSSDQLLEESIASKENKEVMLVTIEPKQPKLPGTE